MSTPTTALGATVRRAGTLLMTAALVGASATSAFAESVATPSPTSTATSSATPSASSSAVEPSGSTPAPGDITVASSPTSAAPVADPTTTTVVPNPTSPAASRQPGAKTSSVGTVPPSTLTATAAEDAAAFIARTLAAGDDRYVYPNSTFFDGGNTIDAIVALSVAGAQQAQADSSLAYLEDNLGAYIGAGGEVYAGALAKSLLGVIVAGGNPRSFAGTDLVAELQALETTEGRFSDDSDYGDYSNTIGQALAIIALSRAGAGVTASSVELLLDQQCADGGFRGSIGGGGCTSDADATAFAVQALLAASGTLLCGNGSDGLPDRAEAAATAALDRLEDAQDTSGGLASIDGVFNANTTGVAAQAFLAGGRASAAEAATAFVRTLQYDAAAPEALRGGIAFSAATRSTTVPSDSDLRATPQAALALLERSLLGAAGPDVGDPVPSTTCPPAPTRQPVAAPQPSTPAGPSTPVSPEGPSSGSGGATGSGDGAGPGSDSGGASTPAAAGAPTGSLAQTGSDLLIPVGLGLLFVVVGTVAVRASRRRGAHL